MRAENLIGLAAARGVDLIAAAQAGTSAKAARDTITRGVNGHRHVILIEPPKSRARGHADRSTLRPEWTMSELGFAAAGVATIPFLAACFAFAGDRSNYWTLHGALYREALALAARHHWPTEAFDLHEISAPYFHRMAKLVLDADATPSAFVIPGVFALYMNVSENTWEGAIEPRYAVLCDVWHDWLHEAAARIQSRLREDGDN